MPAPTEYYLSLPGDITIGIASNQELPVTDDETLLLGAYLPEVVLRQAAPENLDMAICHVESADKTLTQGKNEIEIRDSWHGEFPDDLPHLLYSVARTLWLNRGYYPAHAACIGQAAWALLPGHSGVGKTTTALTAMSQYRQKLLSGNTTLLRLSSQDTLQAVAGTRTMTLKTEDFARGAYEASRSVTYGNRTAFTVPPDAQAAGPKDIDKIALVRLSSGQHAWSNLAPLSALHTLYPYFLDVASADCLVAQGNALYFGETPPSARAQLASRLGRAVLNLPVYSGVGDPEFLAQQIVRA